MEIGEPEVRYAKLLLTKAIVDGNCLLCHIKPISAGYSYINLNGKRVRAHRFVWAVVNGPIPEDAYVLHRCDVPRCINPEHLFIGYALDNTQDMLSKGRHRHKHFDVTKVTPEIRDQLLALRQQGLSAPVIANKFGIATSTVYEYTSKGGRRYGQ